MLHDHNGLKMSSKLGRNLFLRNWLKPNLDLVIIFSKFAMNASDFLLTMCSKIEHIFSKTFVRGTVADVRIKVVPFSYYAW